VPVVPLLALVVVAADAVAGTAMMLPVVGLLASLAGQAHVALMPCVLAIAAIPFGRTVVSACTGADRVRWRRSLALTAVTLVVLWAVPFYEQLTGVPRGNLTELYRFFAQQTRAGQPLHAAVSAWADMMIGPLRPDFYVAHGWPFVESPVRWAEWGALVTLALVGAFGIRGMRRHDWFDQALAGLLLLAAAVSLWSTTRIEERIFDHDVFWIVGLGALGIAVAVDGLIPIVVVPTTPSWPRPAFWACVVLLGVAGAAALRDVERVVQQSTNPPADAAIARAVADDLRTYLDRERVRRPLVKIDQDAWGYAAGAILDLQKRGRIVSVEEDWVVMFTPEFRATGQEDAVVTIAMPPEHLRLEARGIRVISTHEPVYAHAEKAGS
jgi:hypothetical protein